MSDVKSPAPAYSPPHQGFQQSQPGYEHQQGQSYQQAPQGYPQPPYGDQQAAQGYPQPAQSPLQLQQQPINHGEAQKEGYYGANPQQQQQQQPQQGQPVQQQQSVGYQTAVPITALGEGPAPIDCPACGMRQMTRVQLENGNTVLAWAAGLCFCFCLGCIPFCISSLKDVAHFCGHCGTRVATFHRSGHTEQHVHR